MPHIIGDEIDDRLKRVVIWSEIEIKRAAQEMFGAIGEIELQW